MQPHKQMARYDAALFDMDGTLLDTAEDIRDALEYTLAQARLAMRAGVDVRHLIGGGAYELLCRALPATADPATAKALLPVFRERYLGHVNEKTRPFDGILSVLTALNEAGIKLAIISNKSDDKVRLLTQEHFGSLIHIAVGISENTPRKPEPDTLLSTMKQLGTTPGRTLYVGDTLTDYLAAKNAGTDCLLVRWGYGRPGELSELPRRFFAEDPAEMLALILED